jgi:hypothetical protein
MPTTIIVTENDAPRIAERPLCEESKRIREMVIKASERLVAATLAFQSDVVMAKSEDAARSSAEMRAAMARCIAANNLWEQHRSEHGCS